MKTSSGGKIAVFVCALLAALLLVTCSAKGGVIRHDVPEGEYLELANAFPATGKIATGTGVLIAPQWVLTAAHCVDPSVIGVTRFVQVSTFEIGGNVYEYIPFLDSIRSPLYGGNLDDDDYRDGHDIALIRLRTPVLNVEPAKLFSGDPLGRVGHMVGYGMSGDGITGKTGAWGTKRAGENVIDRVGGVAIPYYGAIQAGALLLMDFDNPLKPADSSWGSSVPLPLEIMASNGDSGGTVYVDGMVAGIMSFGVSGPAHASDNTYNSDYGDITGAVAVLPHLAWINSIVPEPSSLLMLVMGSALLFRRRR